MVLGTIPLWDQTTLSVNTRMENTLWSAGVVTLAVVVTVAVEYVFRGVHPASDLKESIESRLRTVENVLLAAAKDQPLADEWQKKLTLYSTVGTSRLIRLILRSEIELHSSRPRWVRQLRSWDVWLTLPLASNSHYRIRQPQSMQPIANVACVLADEVDALSKDLMLRQPTEKIEAALAGRSVATALPVHDGEDCSADSEGIFGVRIIERIYSSAPGRREFSANIRSRRLLESSSHIFRIARHTRGDGLLHHLYRDRLARTQLFGTRLLHHGIIDHRFFPAETSAPAKRRDSSAASSSGWEHRYSCFPRSTASPASRRYSSSSPRSPHGFRPHRQGCRILASSLRLPFTS